MSRASPNPLVPFSIACLGIGAFSGLDVLMKSLSIEMGVYNALLWRTSLALVLALLLFLWRKARWPDKSRIRLHVWRGLVTSVMAYLFFWGLVYIPLAEAIGLSFIAPLLALYLAAALLKEKIGSGAVLASIIGLVGTMLVVGGKLSGDYGENVEKGIVAILISAVLYAYNLILQRQQALVAEPVEIALFQNATVVAVYSLFAPLFAVLPGVEMVPQLLAAAVLGIISLLLLSWAYARAEAQVLIPVEYTAFLWAALFGALVFSEEVTVTTLLGTALIVSGCLIAARAQPDRVEHVENTAL